MAKKTYQSDCSSMALNIQTKGADGKISHKELLFVNFVYETEDPGEQAYIEHHSHFEHHRIIDITGGALPAPAIQKVQQGVKGTETAPGPEEDAPDEGKRKGRAAKVA